MKSLETNNQDNKTTVDKPIRAVPAWNIDQIEFDLLDKLEVPTERQSMYLQALHTALGPENQPKRTIEYLKFKLTRKLGDL